MTASVTISPAGAVIAVLFLLSIGSVFYWMLRLPPETPTTVRIARALRQVRRANLILVPVRGTALSDRMVALAAQMAKARTATIEVLYVIEVPWTLPLSAEIPEETREAEETIARAEQIASRYGVEIRTRVLRTRESGPSIVLEAQVTGADVILMGDIPRPGGGTVFGATTAYVFARAPCEIIIDRPALERATGISELRRSA